MEILVLTGMVVLPFISPRDPGPGMLRSKTVNERLMCDRLTDEEAQRRFPGRVRRTAPRGDFIERSAVHCRERIIRPGLRSAHEEAILQDLESESLDLARAAASLRPDLAEATWLVEAFVADASVQHKVAFATKNALMAQGVAVSDRTPVLSAGDLDVITRMEPAAAYPTACLRWTDTGALADGQALLGVVSRDPRETQLHAGICASGRWTWIR